MKIITRKEFKNKVIDKLGHVYEKKLLTIYVKDFEDKADGKAGMSGRRWQRLSPRTVKKKRALGSPYASKILKRWGTLKANINSLYVKRNSTIYVFVPDYKVPYAKLHNNGIKVPKRDIFDELSSNHIKAIEADIVKEAESFIADMFKNMSQTNIKVKI